MANPAIARGFRAVLLGHVGLNNLKGRVHGRVPVGAHFPLLDDLFVATGGPAGTRAGKHLRVHHASTRRAREAGGKGPVLAVLEAVVFGKILGEAWGTIGVCTEGRHRQAGHSKDQRATGIRAGERGDFRFARDGTGLAVAKCNDQDMRKNKGQPGLRVPGY